ncbi:BolA family protein [Methylocaldum szegediense]|uniref:BolA family transcriptional regulator, general stress-responsive regulator n=1 Tax=Methylocaldum szegediense TaxID=73780 RepID=A0ABN8X9Q4_9GAMM|nr:BolA family protein [Methylocaldum szegediense]CAI8963087.1 BolA family transcriptional regulator, general stress-responsive regulator [Methylocaldum szegediense]
MTTDRSARLRTLLEQAFEPVYLEIVDDSRSHAGHAHAGGGHFFVTVCSHRFEGRSMLERHRLVYSAVSEMMPGDIHALSITALTPAERQAA